MFRILTALCLCACSAVPHTDTDDRPIYDYCAPNMLAPGWFRPCSTVGYAECATVEPCDVLSVRCTEDHTRGQPTVNGQEPVAIVCDSFRVTCMQKCP